LDAEVATCAAVLVLVERERHAGGFELSDGGCHGSERKENEGAAGTGFYSRGVRSSADPSTDPGDYEFSHRLRVRFAETDALGIVHHSRHLPMMEEARVAYLRHLGHPYSEIRAEGIEMNVLEAWCKYRRPLVFDDVVDVHVNLAA